MESRLEIRAVSKRLHVFRLAVAAWWLVDERIDDTSGTVSREDSDLLKSRHAGCGSEDLLSLQAVHK